jgi:multidrug efflux pump subunit AcrB
MPLALGPDVSKIEILGAQDERIFVEFSMRELATLGVDRGALIAALQAQNVVQPAGTIETGDEALSLRVSGAPSTPKRTFWRSARISTRRSRKRPPICRWGSLPISSPISR